jgi:hypothetical protein
MSSVKVQKLAYNVCPLADARGSVRSTACSEPRPLGSGLGLSQLGTRAERAIEIMLPSPPAESIVLSTIHKKRHEIVIHDAYDCES